MCPGIGSGNTTTLCWVWWGMWRATIASTGKMGAHYLTGQGIWWHRACKRPCYGMPLTTSKNQINNLDIPKVLIPDGPTHDCWWSWTMSLWGHSPSSLKGYGNQEGFLKTGTKQMSLLTSKRAIKCMKESYRFVSLPLISGKRMGPIILEIISKHMKDMNYQQGFVKGKSCLMTWNASSIK